MKRTFRHSSKPAHGVPVVCGFCMRTFKFARSYGHHTAPLYSICPTCRLLKGR